MSKIANLVINQNEISNKKQESDSPGLESFYVFGGSSVVKSMTNFTALEFDGMHNVICDYVSQNWIVGRKCKFTYSDA